MFLNQKQILNFHVFKVTNSFQFIILLEKFSLLKQTYYVVKILFILQNFTLSV